MKIIHLLGKLPGVESEEPKPVLERLRLSLRLLCSPRTLGSKSEPDDTFMNH